MTSEPELCDICHGSRRVMVGMSFPPKSTITVKCEYDPCPECTPPPHTFHARRMVQILRKTRADHEKRVRVARPMTILSAITHAKAMFQARTLETILTEGQNMKNLRLKTVLRHDEIQGHYRLFRVMWERGTVGDGAGYSNMLSVAVQRKLFWFERFGGSWLLIILGLRIHRKRSFWGIFG